MNCPKCHADCKKHGKTRDGQQRYRCVPCKLTTSEPKALPGIATDVETACRALNMLLEGVSIRATARLTGLAKSTLLRLIAQAGEQCRQFLSQAVNDVQADEIQCDEIWSFVACKERTAFQHNMGEGVGDCYVYTALCRESKLLICYLVGRRCSEHAEAFSHLLASCVATSRPHVSTDGYGPYRVSIPDAFNGEVNHGVVIKSFGNAGGSDARRYSPARIIGVKELQNCGISAGGQTCTSHVERSNLTIRMQNRRFTRLSNGFSKKWENHEAMFALFAAWYNFCRKHQTIKTTPAVKAGLASEAWSLERLLTESAKMAA